MSAAAASSLATSWADFTINTVGGVVTLSQTERNLSTIANVDARDFSDLYQIPEYVTHEGDSRIGGDLIQHGKRRRFAMAAAIALREDCQSALDWDPLSASNRDPFERRVRPVALAPSELAGVAETVRAQVV